MKIYTKTGDDGTTSLFDGTRVSKHDTRVDAYGCVDELNGALGLVAANLSESIHQEMKDWILEIQRDLFALGAQLANPAQKKQKEKAAFDEKKVAALEKKIDFIDSKIEPLKTFVLPGGTIAAAWLDHARTICRKAERKMTALSAIASLEPVLIIYINRLSDFLFMAARYANYLSGKKDIPWE